MYIFIFSNNAHLLCVCFVYTLMYVCNLHIICIWVRLCNHVLDLFIHTKVSKPRNLYVEYTLSIKIAQKPYIIVSLGPKALKYESFEGKGYANRTPSKAPLKESILTWRPRDIVSRL